MPSLYRPNVAAILMRPCGRILVCQRKNQIGAWQFPQGGVDEEESLEQALEREVQEEIGFTPSDYTQEKCFGLYRYDYPAEVRLLKHIKKRCYQGQEQTYFLCSMISSSLNPNLDQEHPEFDDFAWILPQEFQLSWLPDFKKDVYKQVFADIFHITLV